MFSNKITSDYSLYTDININPNNSCAYLADHELNGDGDDGTNDGSTRGAHTQPADNQAND